MVVIPLLGVKTGCAEKSPAEHYKNMHMAHLDEHRLLSEKQHEFRKWHSCETQLITVIDDWAQILDNQGQFVTLILDFEKPLTLSLMNFSKANGLAMEFEGKQ